MNTDNSSTGLNHNDTVDVIIRLYIEHGEQDYIGEDITQNQHMIQMAEMAERNNASDMMIVATFLHDIGHLIGLDSGNFDSMGGYGVRDHESIASGFLKSKGFPEMIHEIVRLHVDAKRYLITTNPCYIECLSDASKQTLMHQGSRMTPDEIVAFERNPYSKDVITLRKYDDAGKNDIKYSDEDKKSFFKKIRLLMLRVLRSGTPEEDSRVSREPVHENTGK